jgi:hypothetical protein
VTTRQNSTAGTAIGEEEIGGEGMRISGEVR